jgi:hypothetical protein
MRGDRQRYRCGSSDPGKLCAQTADAERVDRLVLGEVGAAIEGIATDSRVQAALRRVWERQASDNTDAGQKVKRLEAQMQRTASGSPARLSFWSTGRSSAAHTTT